MTSVVPVILAGGVGTRLWPLSRESYPKQFLELNDEYSLLQQTWLRAEVIADSSAIVIANEEHRFIVSEHLRKIGANNVAVVLEPVGRNTAAAIAAAALIASASEQDPILLVLSADHMIADKEGFIQTLRMARKEAEKGKFIIFGVSPTNPETGYGYIERLEGDGIQKVENFVEKPDKDLADQYLQSGRYVWNSGIFMFLASVYLQELQEHCPDILRACQRAVRKSSKDLDFIRLHRSSFEESPSLSIDYAILEKTKNAWVMDLGSEWRDVGSWDSVWGSMLPDKNGNVLSKSVISDDCSNLLALTDSRLIATIGLDNLIIVDTVDALLIADKNKSQQIKQVVSTMKNQGYQEASVHRKVYRPWGTYEIIATGHKFIVKRILVNVNSSLSLQVHNHRSEHWIVVVGVAEVTKSGAVKILNANESIYIQAGECHRLANVGDDVLEVIEVQSGEYLSEDDIIRYDDKYGRIFTN